MTATTTPSPARAQLTFQPRPCRVAVKGIKALAESTELSASDEIYLITVAVDLTRSPIPAVRAVLTGTWGSVDTGEFHPAIQVPPGTPASTVDALDKLGVVGRPVWPLAASSPSSATLTTPSSWWRAWSTTTAIPRRRG